MQDAEMLFIDFENDNSLTSTKRKKKNLKKKLKRKEKKLEFQRQQIDDVIQYKLKEHLQYANEKTFNFMFNNSGTAEDDSYFNEESSEEGRCFSNFMENPDDEEFEVVL